MVQEWIPVWLDHILPSPNKSPIPLPYYKDPVGFAQVFINEMTNERVLSFFAIQGRYLTICGYLFTRRRQTVGSDTFLK